MHGFLTNTLLMHPYRMMMRGLYAYLFVGIVLLETLCPIKVNADVPNYVFKSITNPELEKIGGLWKVVQDKQGFMWFAGERGLIRYDGYEYKLIANRDKRGNLSSEYAQDLFVDKRNNIWIATHWGLNRYDTKTDTVITYFNDPTEIRSKPNVEHYQVNKPKKDLFQNIPGQISLQNPVAYGETTPKNQQEITCGDTFIDLTILWEDVCLIGYTDIEEYVEYIVYSEEASNYIIELDMATGEQGKYAHLDVNGLNVSRKIHVSSDGWGNRKKYPVIARFPAGESRLRLTFDTGAINLFGMSIRKTKSEVVNEPVKNEPKKKPVSISSNDIRSVVGNDNNEVWIGTRKGVDFYDEKSNSFTYIGFNDVNTLFLDSKDRLWVGMYHEGLQVYDTRSKVVLNFWGEEGSKNKLTNPSVTKIFEDSSGYIWIGTHYGLNKFVEGMGGFEKYTVHSGHHMRVSAVSGIGQDRNGFIWVSGDGTGIDILNPKDPSRFRPVMSTPNNSLGLVNNNIRSLNLDNNENVWLSHYPTGVSFFDPYASVFRNYFHNASDSTSLSNSDILSIYERNNGDIWIGTEDGLNYFDRKRDKFKRFTNKSIDSLGLPSNPVIEVIEDDREVVWISTWNGGIGWLENDYQKFNRLPNHVEYDPLRMLAQQSSGEIWAGSNLGLQKIEYINNQYHYSKFLDDPIFSYLEDSKGESWFGGTGLLIHRDLNKNITQYKLTDLGMGDASNGDIEFLFESKDKRIWFATPWGVFNYDLVSEDFNTFEHYQKLADRSVNCMLEDGIGNLWFGTRGGLSRFNLDSQEIRNFYELDGLAGNIYKRLTCLRSQNGDLFFGSTKGLTVFRSENVLLNDVPPEIKITKLKLFNKLVDISSENGLLSKAITYEEKLILNHQQSVFSLDFAVLDFNSPEKNQYAYKLEGFEDNWNYIGNKRSATYTNLDPGKYTFRVKGSNNHGVWNEEGTAIDITILPPWWLTWWAYCIYVVLVIAMYGWISYTRWQKKRAEYELKLNHQLRQVDKMKDSFLANTSHELRTPLNGIIGLSESLIEGATGPLGDKTVDNLKMIVNSGRRLSCLINDILDFSKLKDHTIQLNHQPVNLHSLVEHVLALSSPLIGNKPLKLKNAVPKDLPVILADENRLQQILYNLVGNAIKFSHEGFVSVATIEQQEVVWIEVEDTGIGIEEEKLGEVFQPFEQAQEDDDSYGGTGLGLAVTKQLVELHGGEIEVRSEVGKGSVFRFSMALSSKLINDSDSVELNKKLVSPNVKVRELPSYHETSDESDIAISLDDAKYHILVVDDEAVNRQVLVNMLTMRNHKTSVSDSGIAALEFLESNSDIDLVLLDVMMPQMSGYEVCRQLRENYTTAQLPIIFLTAKNQVADLEAGYAAGGSDFLTKPIAKEELIARVETHLELKAITQNLESLVETRTKALSDSNKALTDSKNALEKSYEYLKQTQSKLVHAEKMSSLGTLVAGVGHEINSPSSFAFMATENLEKFVNKFEEFVEDIIDEDTDEEIVNEFKEHFSHLRKSFSSIKVGTTRIQDIVKNLRTFSRIDDKEFKLARIQSGIDSTVDLVKANYKHQVEFVKNYHADPLVNCIPSELNQVFMNIIVNACQAIVGDREDIDTKRRGTLTIETSAIDDHLLISFEDTGCGMPENVISHMFDPFFTTKGETQGTGLGLSITYGIIEKHKGWVEVNSEVGEGTVVKVFIPASKQ